MSVATVRAGCVGIERSRLCGDIPVHEAGLKAQVDERATWNLWANRELVNWLRTLARFPDLAESAVPILHGEDFWLARMQGRESLPGHAGVYAGSPPELLRSLLAQSGRLVSYARTLPESALLESLALDDAAAGHCRLSRAEMFRQCFRDSAYHRDRVIAVARKIHLGDAPMSDYLRYPSPRVC